MVQLTEQAAQELKKIRDEVQEQHPGSVSRLFQSGEGEFNLTIGLPVEGARELETSRSMTNFTLDYQETPQGHNFVFKERAE